MIIAACKTVPKHISAGMRSQKRHLWHAFGDPGAALRTHDEAPAFLGVGGDALRHVMAVEAQVGQQHWVECCARVPQRQHERPRRHACRVPHLETGYANSGLV